MIPGLLSQDVSTALREFIVTGYETDTWPFSGKFEQLIHSSGNGEAFLKGPYVSVQLPFSKQTSRTDYFSSFETEHSPYAHQQTAWNRLQSSSNSRSTIVATGTGSGKTECFLYPILDHCLKVNHPGIKAIIIYPMNALAVDQAKRFASVIHETPELKGKVRVGLFVGGPESTDKKAMAPEHVITCKRTMRQNPPDVLLTNYKMLDFLLMRPRDQALWKNNELESLRYLVVDELHTFDGAQGSDLAMLIRRLKARLSVKKDHLICVGTSATLGSQNRLDDLAKFASDIFDTDMDKSAIVGESREDSNKFIDNGEYFVLDAGFSPDQLRRENYAEPNAYLSAQVKLFFGEEVKVDADLPKDRVILGRELKKHVFLHNLLRALQDRPATLASLLSVVQKQIPASLKSDAEQVLISFLSLLSLARGERYPGEPFVTLRLQLWVRELRRIVSRVGDNSSNYPVELLFSDDIKADSNAIYLPVVQCSECHTTAWLTAVEQGATHIERDLRVLYNRFFSYDKQVRILLPLRDKSDSPPIDGVVRQFCANCGHLQIAEDDCLSCHEHALITVFDPNLSKQVRRSGVPTIESQHLCPMCQTDNSLILFGARAASLSSVAIHQMFASPINDDKKLIAFSDSVQDAAHRAGFFAARTWQNNVRMALAKTVTHYQREQKKPIPLSDLDDYFANFWLNDSSNAEVLSEIGFITQLIAPNMQSFNDYIDLKQSGRLPAGGDLIHQVKRRLHWEFLSELGLRSQIGRSLEKTGVATLTWDPSLVMNAASRLKDHCLNLLGQAITLAQASQILWGITVRLKRKGAVFDPLLAGFVEAGGNWYLLSRRSLLFMPNLGSYSLLPKFPADVVEKGFERLVPAKGDNWYTRWVTLALTEDTLQLVPKDFVPELTKLAMNALESSGLVIKLVSKKGNNVWGLDASRLAVTTDLMHIKLQRTIGKEGLQQNYGNWVVPEDWLDAFASMPSLENVSPKNKTTTRYVLDQHPRQSMYRRFYLEGMVERVIGHEHTALLERDYREALESRFMARPPDRLEWYENLLSATPTLEMGIDIGDLSSVMMCSVPPSQASYLQRAGRGGRRDGNSFVLTVANGNPHDLFFYADPLKLIADDVEAPGIYLNASSVLKRQLLAFCFDHWGVTEGGQQVIPSRMQPVLDAVETQDQNRFPYTLLRFISSNRDVLWDGFEQLIVTRVSDYTLERLRDYFLETNPEQDALPLHVLSQLQKVVKERAALVRDQRGIESELRKVRKLPQDPARDELEAELARELDGIKTLKTGFNRKETLNFLTDEGLLPNYAFPEEGTTLHSVIYRRLKNPIVGPDGKTTSYESTTFEYSRPAHAALNELAPESIFYASNRKVQIERVEMANGENLEWWRLCPNCSYSEQDIGQAQEPHCPRCADRMWSNIAQLKPMIRLTQVYANTRDDEAMIGDDSETREPTFFNRQMLIDFDPGDILYAYATKGVSNAFGFEFVKKVNFKEINFGEKGGAESVFNVAGVELARPGFKLCKECGMVQKARGKSLHMYKCQYRDVTEPEDAGIVECLYLYRQYESEAVRIMLPRLSISQREEQLQSFVAALQLGLKTRFGGKVDHIHIAFHDEPVSGSTDRSSYLVLYDTVPGGTGYLQELLSKPEHLVEMLQSALDILEKCDCQNSVELDGCYSCLYAYRNSYGMEQTSRRTAMEMLREILDESDKLESVVNLGSVSQNPWADSELEARFPEAIQAMADKEQFKDKKIRITKDIVNGKVGFKLELGDRLFTVEPHKKLDTKDGVTYPCEPDFFITADRASDQIPPVAVFLDGYRYHKPIVTEDLMKRQGIFRSAPILVWSLTWHDLNHAFASSESKIPNPFVENTDKQPKQFIDKVTSLKGLKEHQSVAEMKPLAMLLSFLLNPDVERWRQLAAIRSLCWLNQDVMMTCVNEFVDASARLPSQFTDRFNRDDLLFAASNMYQNEDASLETFVAGSEAAIRDLDVEALFVGAVYDVSDADGEGALPTWQRLLQILNLGQFIPNFVAVTKSGLENASFSNLRWGAILAPETNTAWDSIRILADSAAIEIVDFLIKNDLPEPIVGYELSNDIGAVIAEAELAWKGKEVAFLLEHQVIDSQPEFEQRGWSVLTSSSDEQTIIDKLGGAQ